MTASQKNNIGTRRFLRIATGLLAKGGAIQSDGAAAPIGAAKSNDGSDDRVRTDPLWLAICCGKKRLLLAEPTGSQLLIHLALLIGHGLGERRLPSIVVCHDLRSYNQCCA
jgi:hypothetical protein